MKPGFMSKELDAPAVEDGAVIHLPPVAPIDKTLWGEGPWQHEPDHIQYQDRGFDCLVMRSSVGNLCGYIAIPEGHPWHDLEPDQVLVNVHGGLEWKQLGNDEWRRSSRNDIAWFGFSCSHFGDYYPIDGLIRPEPEDGFFPKQNYKTVEFVQGQIVLLCDAAVEAARTS